MTTERDEIERITGRVLSLCNRLRDEISERAQDVASGKAHAADLAYLVDAHRTRVEAQIERIHFELLRRSVTASLDRSAKVSERGSDVALASTDAPSADVVPMPRKPRGRGAARGGHALALRTGSAQDAC